MRRHLCAVQIVSRDASGLEKSIEAAASTSLTEVPNPESRVSESRNLESRVLSIE